MMLRTRKLHFTLAVLALLSGCATADSPLGVQLPALPGSDLIDADVSTRMGGDTRVPVLVLARTQLLEPGGLRQFAAQHGSQTRSSLRATLLVQLKTLARTTEQQILPALPPQSNARVLWLINGIAAELTQTEIEALSRRNDVAYIYWVRSLPARRVTRQPVASIVPDGARPPFSAAGRTVSWNLEQLGAPRVWSDLGITGEGVVVGVLDEGVTYDVPDLRRNLWINSDEVPNNSIDDDGNGYVDDRHGYDFGRDQPETGGMHNHGTIVAAIVAGEGVNGIVTGIAPRARIMPLIMADFPSAVLALQYALDNGADIVNMSFSIPNLGNLRGAWRMMADHAVAAGLVLVSGAGNFRQSAATPVQLRIPEDIPSVIAVGGVTRELALTSFSSTGPVEWSNVRFFRDYPLPAGLTKPDVVAFPGPFYPVLQPTGYLEPNLTIAGNSFSSPHVAGTAALVLSANRELPAWRVKEIIEATARDLDTPGKDVRTGAGLVDAHGAVSAALRSGN